MIVDGNVCNLKNRVIEVFAEESFTILTQRKIVAAMRAMVKRDKRYNESSYSFSHMVVELL